MGAAGVSYTATETELAFIRKAHDDCSAFLSICGRCVHPLAAGSLEGKTATAPRPMVEMLRQSAPGVKWVERRWTHDGKMWTSGALLNGLDLMVAFVREVFGERAGLVTSAIEIGAWPCRGAEY